MSGRGAPGSAVLAVLAVLLVVLSACSPGSSASGATPPDGPLPTTTVTPYVDVTAGTVPDLAAVGAATGQRDFVLAFALADDGACRPAWGGTLPIDDATVAGRAAAARAAGGRITVATGGAEGDYLENVCDTPGALTDAYGTALDAVGGSALDVDVETAVPTDRVAAALAALQHRRALPVSVTLPVTGDPDALTPAALSLLQALSAAGVAVRVNVMAMDFPYTGRWTAALVAAGEATARRLGELWPGADAAAVRRRIGVTVMIGRNDTGPVTTLRDTATVAAAARSAGLGSVGMWSVARDGPCPDETAARPGCSGTDEEPSAYLRVLRTTFVG